MPTNQVSDADFASFIEYMEEHAGPDWIRDTANFHHVNDWVTACGHVGHEAELLLRAVNYYGN